MVDRSMQPSRFQAMFPGKADPNEFLTASDPGMAGIGTLIGFTGGGKMAIEGAKSAVDSGRFVRDAMTGQISPWAIDPETGETVANPAFSAGSMETALNIATPSFTRSALRPAEANTLGIFGSTSAKTANLEALDIAKSMAEKGAGRDEIFRSTGWFEGKDGVWRFEIPDTAAKMKFNPLPSEAKLKDILDHPELYAAYPDMAEINVKREFMNPSLAGYFDPDTKTVGVNRLDTNKKSTLLHEGQHWVQDKEGMVMGSNTSEMTPYREELYRDMMEARGPSREGGVIGWFKNLIDPKPTASELMDQARRTAYHRKHGEVEARNVERRAKEGYDKAPWETIDVPAEKVVLDENLAGEQLRRARVEASPLPDNDPWKNVGWDDSGPAFGYAQGGMVNSLDRYLNALGTIESGNNYSALGPRTEDGARAYGRYQVMDFNIPTWTQEALGRSLTPEQFLADRNAQDAVARHRFGQYVEKYGNPYDAASMWFSGRPMRQAGEASDVTGTSVPQYVGRFANALGQPMEGDAEGIAALNAEELALMRERASMDQGPSRSQRQRMISAITDFYQSTLPKQADFSLLRRRG